MGKPGDEEQKMKTVQKIAIILVLAAFLSSITSCVILKGKLFPAGQWKKIEKNEDSKDAPPGEEKKDKEKAE